MATSQHYITAGIPPDDNGADDGSTLFYITAGLVPDDTAAAGVTMPLFIHHQNQMRA